MTWPQTKKARAGTAGQFSEAQTNRTLQRPRLRGNRCRCAACNLTFRSVTGFERHRSGPETSRQCMTVAELAAAALIAGAGALAEAR